MKQYCRPTALQAPTYMPTRESSCDSEAPSDSLQQLISDNESLQRRLDDALLDNQALGLIAAGK